MTSLFPRLAALSLIFSAPLAAQKEGVEHEYRKFTGSNGKEIQAVLLNRDDEKKIAVLLLRNGKRANVPFDKLSDEDQTYLKAWNKEKAIFLQSCRGLTVKQLLELRGYEPVRYELDGNQIIVKGTLNDHPAIFEVDTGAGTTILHLPLAKAAGCEVGPLDQIISGVSGEYPAAWSKVATMKFGSCVFRDETILATDRNFKMPKIMHHDDRILLGAEYLTKLETVISYKERIIFFRPDNSDKNELVENEEQEGDDIYSFRIFTTKQGKKFRGKIVGKTDTSAELELTNGKKKLLPFYNLSEKDASYAYNWSQEKATFMQHCRSLTIEELLHLRKYQSFQYERKGNHIFVGGTLNDHKVTWMIDTGAHNSLLHVFYAEKYGCEVGPMSKKVYGIGGTAPAAATEIKKITLGKAILTNRTLLSTDLQRNSENKEQSWVGLFGADYMRELEAVITYRENRIFLKQNK